MERDTSAEPLFATDDIQGDILVGLLKKVEKFVFFTIADDVTFRTFLSTLDITSMQDCLDQRAAVAAYRDRGLLPAPGLNLAFTHAGLAELGAAAQLDSTEFTAGMAASRKKLADPDPEEWEILGPKHPVHGVFLVTGATEAEVDTTIALRLAPAPDNGWATVRIEVGTVRPEPFVGHEHFGYADGVSQPAVRGRIGKDQPLEPTTGHDPDQAAPGRDLLGPGLFVFGYPRYDPDDTEAEKGPQFTDNGAFLVFRRLAQDVPEFDRSLRKVALSVDPTGENLSADLLGAQVVGRWKSGAPLITAPHEDDLTTAAGTAGALDFEFGGDRYGLLCPWAAHIRKVYARDDVRGRIGPTRNEVMVAEAETQRHRMIRRGIAFGPELTANEALNGATTEARGLLFACYVTDIAEQFEFVQASRANDPDFVQPGAGVDAIIGQSDPPDRLSFAMAMPFDDDGSRRSLKLGRFVRMEGGEYFFAPSIPAIRSLGK